MYKYFKCDTAMYLVDDALKEAGEIIVKEGFKRVFIISGSLLKRDNNKEKLEESLNSQGITYDFASGVKPNPDIEFIEELLPRIREFKPDLILAIGGGSIIDTCKNIIHTYNYDGDPLDFNKGKDTGDDILPLGVILTLSASGSEMSNSCVISSRKEGVKLGRGTQSNYPTFSIYDPKLTYSVSPYQTACGLVDIISHSFERYFNPSSEYELCDLLALAVIRDIVDISPVVLKDPTNYDARKSMMLASSMSHNKVTSYMKDYVMRCHKVEHQMSAQIDTLTHGLGLRFLLNEYLKQNEELFKEKILKFGHFVFDLNTKDPKVVEDKFEEYLSSLGLANDMEEVGFTKEEKEAYIAQLKL